MKTVIIPYVGSIEASLQVREEDIAKILKPFNQQVKQFFDLLENEFKAELEDNLRCKGKFSNPWVLKGGIGGGEKIIGKVKANNSFHLSRLSPSCNERNPRTHIHLSVGIYVNRKGIFSVLMGKRTYSSETEIKHSFLNLSGSEVFDLMPKIREFLQY